MRKKTKTKKTLCLYSTLKSVGLQIPERPNIDKSDVLISEDLMPTLSVPSPEPSSLIYTKVRSVLF